MMLSFSFLLLYDKSWFFFFFFAKHDKSWIVYMVPCLGCLSFCLVVIIIIGVFIIIMFGFYTRCCFRRFFFFGVTFIWLDHARLTFVKSHIPKHLSVCCAHKEGEI